MLKGLPASGKTTLARELVSSGYYRVNKDDLRSMINNGKWNYERENKIIQARNLLVKNYLNSGMSVVVDDTNFAPAHEEDLRKIAEEYDAEFEVKFVDTPLGECIERDKKREHSVGAKVINEMYEKYIYKPVKYDGMKSDCYIFDIDGTLAKMKGRSPYEWSKVGEDVSNDYVVNILSLCDNNNHIIIFSGRDACCREETIAWLDRNDIRYDELHMRPEGDKRPDTEIKMEMYNNFVKDKYNVMGVFDDRLSVCRMWYELGLPLFRVGNPDAEF